MERNDGSAQMETTEAIIDEWAMEADHGDESVTAAELSASLDAPLDDAEPWQRLGDILGRITGIVDME